MLVAKEFEDKSISQDAYDRLLIEEHWLSMRPTDDYNRAESLIMRGFADVTKSDDALAVISQFVSLVENGMTPPAHILVAIAKAFIKYNSSETISIDESFNLEGRASNKTS